MSMHNGDPDLEAQLDRQQQMDSQRAMQDRASQMGMSAGDIQEMIDQDDLLDTLLDYDIKQDPDDGLGDVLATELSNLYMTSNLSPHEVGMMQTWTDQEAHMLSLEYPTRDSLATGTRGQIMYGAVTPAEQSTAGGGQGGADLAADYGPKPPLTDSMERRIWSTADAKKAAVTRSKRGWLIKRFTEFVAVGVTEQREHEESSGGLLSGLKNRLI